MHLLSRSVSVDRVAIGSKLLGEDAPGRNHARGGAIVTLEATLADTDETLRLALSDAFESWREAIREAFARLPDSGLLALDADLEALTTWMLAGVHGGLLGVPPLGKS